MNYLHARKNLQTGQIVKSYCSHQANFILLDDINYNNFKNGRRFSYFGGFFKTTNLQIVVPYSGYWNIVLDFSMHKGNIKYAKEFEIINI